MAGLLERPPIEAPVAETPPPPEAEASERLCPTCSGALAEGQDWCLECGAAQPGRLGRRPGWRSALAVLALTGMLASGAVAAAYAAMSSDARREAAAAAPPAVAPVVAPPAPAAAPTPPPAPPAPPAPKADDPAPQPPPAPPAPDPAPPVPDPDAAAGDPAAGEDDALLIELDPKTSAVTYDPSKLTTDENRPKARYAIDPRRRTVWNAPVDPVQGTVNLGIVVSLEEAQRISALRFTVETPGFNVESYGAKSEEVPADILDEGWKHLSDKKDVGVEEELKIDGKFRHVLLWVTLQPADTEAVISKLELLK